MSNKLDMKKDTNNRKDKTKYDGPEKPDAYMGNDKQWVFRALVLAFIDMCIIAISFFFALMIRFEFSYSHIPLSFLEGYLHIVPLFMVISLVVFIFSGCTTVYGVLRASMNLCILLVPFWCLQL